MKCRGRVINGKKGNGARRKIVENSVSMRTRVSNKAERAIDPKEASVDRVRAAWRRYVSKEGGASVSVLQLRRSRVT